MKFPSIFRLPKHQRFHYQPRFYDPVKEDIENRRKFYAKKYDQNDIEYKSSISGTFKRKRTNVKSLSTSLIQLIIAVVLMATFIGWLFYGNVVFNFFLIIIPIYFVLRLRNIFRKKDKE